MEYDPIAVKQLKQEIGPDVFAMVVDLFALESQKHIAALSLPCPSSGARACHNLKTHFRTFGAHDLADQTEQVETLLRQSGQLSPETLHAITQQTNDLRARLKQEAAQ